MTHDALVAALKDVELCLCQARIASTIVRKVNRTEFLRNVMAQLESEVNAVIKLAEGE